MKILEWIRKLRQPERVVSEPSGAPVRVQRIVSEQPPNTQIAVAGRLMCYGKFELTLQCGHRVVVLEADYYKKYYPCPICNAR